MTVSGEGMVFPDESKGDLHIVFDVEFPKTLSVDQKAKINEILAC